MYVGVPHECSTSENQKRESLEKLTVVRCCVSAGNQMGLSARAASATEPHLQVHAKERGDEFHHLYLQMNNQD